VRCPPPSHDYQPQKVIRGRQEWERKVGSSLVHLVDAVQEEDHRFQTNEDPTMDETPPEALQTLAYFHEVEHCGGQQGGSAPATAPTSEGSGLQKRNATVDGSVTPLPRNRLPIVAFLHSSKLLQQGGTSVHRAPAPVLA
jgi:hypothetical protein